jgi:DNA (cytosine-5)-methyltransferase 1
LEHNQVSAGGILEGEICPGMVEDVRWCEFSGRVRVLAAGAPCQPFSLGGKHRAYRDGRNGFPEVFRAIRELTPQTVLVENVQGLIRPSFRPYLEYIVRQLEFPRLEPSETEDWQEHDKRLQDYMASADYEPEYNVTPPSVLNAADYGAAQSRKRVFLVATHREIIERYEISPPTHSRASLVASQKSGEYWERHGIHAPREAVARDVGSNSLWERDIQLEPWRTVRDELRGLPEPAVVPEDTENNHWYIPGARVYPGHSGSILDWPSKTIKAGVHGVPGGENIIRMDDGSFRYYTLREAARLQGFPDRYVFLGSKTHVTRQIGNAVPCQLAKAVAIPLRELLDGCRGAQARRM